MAYRPFTGGTGDYMDYNILQNTGKTLQARQDAAMLQYNRIAQQISKFNFAPEEDAYRAKLMSDITAVRDQFANANDGYLGYNLNNLIDAETKILTNPGVIGREKYNTERQEYLKQLDSSSLPETYKQYYRLKAGYNYKDQFDEKGNVIGGSKFEPIERPTSVINMAAIEEQGVRLAAKESGGGTGIAPRKTSDGMYEYYNTTTTQWEKLSPEKIKKGIKAVLENTPGALESLQQDLKIDKWRGYVNKDYAYNYAFDETGSPVDLDTYLDARLKNTIAAASYYNFTSHTSMSNFRESASVAQAKTNGMVQSLTNMLTGGASKLDIGDIQSGTYRTENNSAQLADQSVKDGKEILNNLLKNKDKTITGRAIAFKWSNDDAANRRAIIKYLKSPEDKAYALRIYDEMAENRDYIASLTSGMSKETLASFNDYNAIINGGTIKNEKTNAKYQSFMKELFPNRTDTVRQYFGNKDAYDNAIAALGGTENIKKLGIQIGTNDDGERYIELNGNNKAALNTFADAITIGLSSSGFFNKLWNSTIGDNRVTRISNGEETTISSGRNPMGSVIGKYKSFVDDAKSKYKSSLKQADVIAPVLTIAATTPIDSDLGYAIFNDPANAQVYSQFKSAFNEQLPHIYAKIDVNQTGAYIFENGGMRKVTSAEAMKINSQLHGSNASNIISNPQQDFETGRWGLNLTIQGIDSKDKSKNITVFVPDAIGRDDFTAWNMNPEFISLNNVARSIATGKPIRVGTAGQGTSFNIDLVPSDNNFIVKLGNKNSKTIDNKTAQELLTYYTQYRDAVNGYFSGLNPELVQNNVAVYAAALTNILKQSPNDESVDVTGIYNDLINYITNFDK